MSDDRDRDEAVATDRPTLYVSAPEDWRSPDAAVMPYAAHQPRQRLLGFEGQMSAFCSVAAQAGQVVAFLPFPEVFSTELSIRLGLGSEAAGSAGPPPHLRFGPATHARLLKGSHNLVVLGGQDPHPPVVTGRHPFASSRHLPAGVSRVLRLDAAPDGEGAGIAAPAITTVSGVPIPQASLPDLFRHADLLGPAEPRSPAHRWLLRQSGLQVQSCRELDAAAWSGAAWSGVGAAEPAPPSRDFGRWLQARRGGGAIDAAPGAVLVPWNLAHPGSIVPDLLDRMARFSNAGTLPMSVVLLPFNDQAVSGRGRLAAFERIRAALAPSAAAVAFVARLRDLAGARALAGLVDAAWIDANDPEWLWNARRLAAIGVPGVLLGGGPEAEGPAGELDLRRVPADDELEIWDESEFGRRLYRPRTLAVRELHRLCAASARPERRPPPPHPPQQQRDAARAAFREAVEPFLSRPRAEA